MLDLASIHIPKAAGTSLRRHLTDWYGDDLALTYPHAGTIHRPASMRAHHGHATQFMQPAARITTTVLREPVARVVSHYHYLRTTPPVRTLGSLHYAVRSGASLAEFARLAPNLQSAFITNIDAVDIVGTVERMEAYVLRLARALGQPEPRFIQRVNRTGHYPQPGEADRRVIVECNELDAELYARAVEHGA